MISQLQHFIPFRRKNRRLGILFGLFVVFLTLMSISSHSSTSTDQEGPCTSPKKNLLYIKMIKCASETLSAVFRRYAYTRHLSIVLPISDKIYLGWPYAMDRQSYRPSKTGGFNFLVDHAVYNEEFMSDLMPDDTVFVTSIREPFAQFKSMFHYYNLVLNSNMSLKIHDPITEYLTHIDKYETAYKSHAMRRKRYCIPDGYSMTKNLMAFNLGFPAGKPDGTRDASDDEGFITHFIKSIETKFKLIIIVEYFDESIVLLKRLMCWSIKDILYKTRNVGSYKAVTGKNMLVEKENIRIYNEWSNVDYKLYDHFRKLLWEKVKNEGSSFYNELRYFKRINRLVNKFCDDLDSEALERYNKINFAKSSYSEAFVIDNNFCKAFGSTLLEESKKQYDDMPETVDPVYPQKVFC